MMIWINTSGGEKLRVWVVGVLFILMSPCIAVQAHTPNVMMSILKEDGPVPKDVLETAGFVAGDGIKFKMGDGTNNSTIRVSIDIDDDGVFNESVDYFSPWMVFDCQYDENGTLLNSECVESNVFYFNGTNGSGIYSYQVERMINGSHTDFWVNTIFVGVDIHEEGGLPSVGDCFGAGCEEVEDLGSSDSNSKMDLISALMVISAIGLVVVSLSILSEKSSEEE
tara:strand:+ start:2562 stop:3233 length:672 start_codon:yes stop_codon:yes gene_type:complete